MIGTASCWNFQNIEKNQKSKKKKKNPRITKNRVDRVSGNTTNFFFGLMRSCVITPALPHYKGLSLSHYRIATPAGISKLEETLNDIALS